MDELIDLLCTGSDRQIDPCIFPRLQALKGKPDGDIKDELLAILDDCAYGSLASDFVMHVLHVMWLNAGGTEGELRARRHAGRGEC